MAEPENLGESAPSEAGAPSTTEANPKALSCLALPSFSEACGFINSRYSCLVKRTHRRHIALPPKYLNKKRSGIKEHLSAELLKYNVALGGVPVAYDNIKLVGGLGDIHDDIGYIHINIEADFIVFQPESRQKLVGVVNKRAPSHIGCLIHGCFNASIPRPVTMPVDAWKHMELNIGDQLEFEAFRMDSDAEGVFFIRGRLPKLMETKAIEKLSSMSEEQTVNVSDDEVQNGSEIAEEGAVGETKKKKRGKRFYEETLSQNEYIVNQGDADLSLEEAPKKKRKKHKHQEALSQDLSVEVDGSGDNSAVLDSVMDSSYQSTEIILARGSKKKKRRDSLQNSDHDVAVDRSMVGLDSMSVISSSEERKAKKSKKKKHKGHSDLESSLQNGITEDSSFTGDSTLEGLEREPGSLKKKHKKKHTVL
ncbi:DNA-directed RNA polymerase I subunit RPA43 [Rhinoderma darwinii]|uniref:DNA-directed RNA polymerase I subunit RPA43 n=1 Tax=Rhinoderma darwinii TaxID=43563 RepID=UPI003F67F450